MACREIVLFNYRTEIPFPCKLSEGKIQKHHPVILFILFLYIAGGRANAPTAVQSNAGLASNETIISTFRIRVDECDRLWVMDTGLADILGNPMQISPPALVIFDLKTDKLIRRYTFPDTHVKEDTFFANVV